MWAATGRALGASATQREVANSKPFPTARSELSIVESLNESTTTTLYLQLHVSEQGL